MPAMIQTGPTTSDTHSHSTATAARPQNSANGQPPRYAAYTATGASTAAEMMRSTKLFVTADAGPPETGSASSTGSGSGLRDQAAEPALALLVFADRRLERGAVEIGPIGRHEHQFAIGRLPEQKIRQPLLAAGADDEIGIGDIPRVKKRADGLHADVGGLEAPFRHFRGDPLRRARDFLARSVIEGHHQSKTVVVLGELFRLHQQPADIRIEPGALADHAHAHAAPVQLGA